MIKNIIICILFGLVIALISFIVSGKFCHCSKIKCPNSVDGNLPSISIIF